jgi:hypothetical protein
MQFITLIDTSLARNIGDLDGGLNAAAISRRRSSGNVSIATTCTV